MEENRAGSCWMNHEEEEEEEEERRQWWCVVWDLPLSKIMNANFNYRLAL